MTKSKGDSYIPLRLHSSYSLAEGAIRFPALFSFCQDQDIPAVAITDTMNLFGAYAFSTQAAKAGVQPIIGCHMRVAKQQEHLNGAAKNKEEYDDLILLVQNAQGYKNILSLVSQGWQRVHAHAMAHITIGDLDNRTEGLLALSGWHNGIIAGQLKQTNEIKAEFIDKWRTLFPDRFYLEIARLGYPEDHSLEDKVCDVAKSYNLPLIATNEAFFIEEDMAEAHDMLLCIADGAYVSQTERRRVSPHQRLKTPQEMMHLFRDMPTLLENTRHLAQRCAFMVESHPPVLPRYPSKRTEEEELREQAKAGLEARLERQVFQPEQSEIEKTSIRQQYYERLNSELEIIIQMGFPGYFLIVADFIQWAKQQKIPVGPGRGSGAGALVAWSLTITDIDPIRFQLIFERFLNPERVSMPDFDIDFCQERRDEVIKYVQSKYGSEHVAHIITFGKLQARAVVRDVGRVMQLPYGQVDRLCKMIPNNPAAPTTLKEAIDQEPQLQAAIKEEPAVRKLADIGQKLEGLFRHASTHAAGVVIGDKPLEETVALYYDPRSPLPATQFNMKDVESIGLVKFDFLGLKTLTVIARTIEILAQRGVRVDSTTIPLDDSKTFALLRKCATIGVFQLESGGMVDVLRRLRPERFEELIALVALYRPGPMDDIPRYLACRHGEEAITYAHPCLEPILKETFGVMVYQEQVMQIARVMGGYTFGQADLLRRAMGKKIQSEMDAQRQIFVKGAIEKGVDENIAASVFEQMAKFAGYGFNKSHSAPYALISYQTAYLKANYTVEFMAALMSLDRGNTDKMNIYRQELHKLGLRLDPPSINTSEADFSVTPDQKGVVFALAAIKNIGENAMAHLVAERKKRGPYKNIDDFVQRVDGQYMTKRQLENLILAGALDCLESNRYRLWVSMENILRTTQDATAARHTSQASLFGAASLPGVKLQEVADWPTKDKLHKEYEATGLYLSGHPLDPYVPDLAQSHILPYEHVIEKIEEGETIPFTLAGVLIAKKVRPTKSGKKFAFLTFSDTSGLYEIALFSQELEAYQDQLDPGELFIIRGQLRKEEEVLRLTGQELTHIDVAMQRLEKVVSLTVSTSKQIEAIKNIVQHCPQGSMALKLKIATKVGPVIITVPANYYFSADTQEKLQAVLHSHGLQDLAS